MRLVLVGLVLAGLVVAAGFGCLGCVFDVFSPLPPVQTGSPQARARRAARERPEPDPALNRIHAARQIVRRVLRSPDNVEFPLPESGEYGVSAKGGNVYAVSGRVLAQNAYGVRVWNDWLVEFQEIAEGYKPLYISVEGEVFFDER